MGKIMSAEYQNNHPFQPDFPCRCRLSLVQSIWDCACYLDVLAYTLHSQWVPVCRSWQILVQAIERIWVRNHTYWKIQNGMVLLWKEIGLWPSQGELTASGSALWVRRYTCWVPASPAAPSIDWAQRDAQSRHRCLMWVSSNRRALLGDVLTAWWHYLRTAQWSKALPIESFNSLLLSQVPPLHDSRKAPFSYSYSLPLYTSWHFLNKSPVWLTLPG